MLSKSAIYGVFIRNFVGSYIDTFDGVNRSGTISAILEDVSKYPEKLFFIKADM